MNRFAPFALAATALVVAILIGIGLILRSPNVGPSLVPSPTPGATVEPSATAEPTLRAAAWSATGSMSEARNDFTATRLADGRVLVAGGDRGFYATPRALTSAELYDPASGTWTATGSMLTGRYRHSATLLPDGRVLVAGGNVGGSGSLGARCCLATAELYDPSTGTWTATGSMIDARVDFAATLLLDGRVLVAGGDSAHVNGTTPGAELYDPVSGSWTATQAMKLAGLYGQTAALLANGKVLVVGGQYGNAAPELYDPSSRTWSSLPCAVGTQYEDGLCNDPANWQTATPLLDGRVLVTGGLGATMYDPGSGTWTPTRAPKVVDGNPRTAVLLSNGNVLLLGGAQGDVSELYDPSTETWTTTASPTAGQHRPAILLLDGRVLLLGGYSTTPDAPLATAELYDPGSGS